MAASTSSPARKILLFTNTEYGQANVVLATAHALMHLAPDTEIHIGSFTDLEFAVRATSEYAIKTSTSVKPKPIVFHEIRGVSRHEAADRPSLGLTNAMDLPPTLSGSAHNIAMIPAIMQPYENEEFAVNYREVERVLGEVGPDVTAVDPLFTPALTLCHHKKVNWLVLAPNTVKDFVVPLQPHLAMLWKYPLVCSALPFPLPWYHIPRNILLNLVAGYALLADSRLRSTSAFIRDNIGSDVELLTANELGVLRAPPKGLRILTANSPEIDYPFAYIPGYVVPCGPIVRAAPAVTDVDPELHAWLRRGPTVYIALGTHVEYDVAEALEMAHALRELLDYAAGAGAGASGKTTEPGGSETEPEAAPGPLQVLWKMARKKVPGDLFDPHERAGPFPALRDVLGPEMDADRVRITDWVTAEPKAVLETGGVVCSVNHGGASSFHEALCAGVPQVVLPPWADCFDFANRAELLGIGRWANKKAKPRWSRAELGAALIEVVYGPRSADMRARAKTLATKFPEGEGRNRAAREILDVATATAVKQ